jgi:hypothetical protein
MIGCQRRAQVSHICSYGRRITIGGKGMRPNRPGCLHTCIPLLNRRWHTSTCHSAAQQASGDPPEPRTCWDSPPHMEILRTSHTLVHGPSRGIPFFPSATEAVATQLVAAWHQTAAWLPTAVVIETLFGSRLTRRCLVFLRRTSYVYRNHEEPTAP